MRLIDADALKEAIKNDIYVVDYGDEGAIYGMFWSGIENAIDEQPTVEQKTGKWVDDGMFITCSACNKCKWKSSRFKNIMKHIKYCPNCGAKMKGEQDGQNTV